MGYRRESLRRGRRDRELVPRAILDPCRGASDSRELRLALRAALHRSVPFDAFCINTCDPITRVVTSSVGDGLSPRDASRLFAIESAGGDVNLLADLDAPAILSATTPIERSRRMREIFLPLGLRDELRAPLVTGEHCWGYLHLFRSTSPFSVEDAERVAAASSEIASALRRTTLASRGPTDVVSPGVVVVGRDGLAKLAAGGASGVMRSLDLDGTQPVPHGVYAVAHRARAERAPPVGTIRTASGWISLHGLEHGRRPAAIVQAAQSAHVFALVLLAHGLTTREREVAERILAGETNADIAEALGISVLTAKDHVKRVFAKTRTSGRPALAALAFGA